MRPNAASKALAILLEKSDSDRLDDAVKPPYRSKGNIISIKVLLVNPANAVQPKSKFNQLLWLLLNPETVL